MNRRDLLVGSLAVPAVSSLWAADAAASGKRLVVTGDMGVVGAKLLPYTLIGTTHEIVGVDRKRGSHEDLNNPHGKWTGYLPGVAAVIHLAWEIIWDNPDAWDVAYQQAAIHATLNLFMACREAKVPLVVFASTMGVSLLPDGVTSIPHGPMYAAAKRFAEDALQVMVWEKAFAAVSVRIGSVSPAMLAPAHKAPKRPPDDDLPAMFWPALMASSGYSVIEGGTK